MNTRVMMKKTQTHERMGELESISKTRAIDEQHDLLPIPTSPGHISLFGQEGSLILKCATVNKTLAIRAKCVIATAFGF